MTAQRLRDAAAKIRTTALDATQGRWLAGRDGTSWAGVETLLTSDGHPIATYSTVVDVGAHCDAAQAALWSPPVALAVADWLEATAVTFLLGSDPWIPWQKSAVAVANLILGES